MHNVEIVGGPGYRPPHQRLPFPVRVAAVVAIGVGIGIATAYLQGVLDQPWASLANAASPWLLGSFAAGALCRRLLGGAMAGLSVGILELASYSITNAARGYSSSGALLVFWAVCAVIGGPTFGAAGHSWWSRPRLVVGLGASMLPAAFGAEALVAYDWRLAYGSSAWLFGAIAVGLLALLGSRDHQHRAAWRWLALTFPIGVVGELLLGLIHRQAF